MSRSSAVDSSPTAGTSNGPERALQEGALPEPAVRSDRPVFAVAQRISRVLGRAAAELTDDLTRIDPRLAELGAAVTPLIVGGKHLRPEYGYWGWRGAGNADCDEIVATVASLDMLHAFALVHDDVVDGSGVRRGRPSLHVRFAMRHRQAGWAGDPDAFGRAMAILVGDLLLVWADRLLAGGGLPAADVWLARPLYDQMRIELMGGESLDVLDQAQQVRSVPAALRTARFKTGKYTIERPLHLGALLTGTATTRLLNAYSAYGLPLGEAFQLRDDVLGVFGDPAITGKPAGDDLREGKRTVLIELAQERAGPSQRGRIDSLVGSPDLDSAGIDVLREIIVETGALASTETMIESRTAAALTALDGAALPSDSHHALSDLAIRATRRTC